MLTKFQLRFRPKRCRIAEAQYIQNNALHLFPFRFLYLHVNSRVLHLSKTCCSPQLSIIRAHLDGISSCTTSSLAVSALINSSSIVLPQSLLRPRSQTFLKLAVESENRQTDMGLQSSDREERPILQPGNQYNANFSWQYQESARVQSCWQATPRNQRYVQFEDPFRRESFFGVSEAQ